MNEETCGAMLRWISYILIFTLGAVLGSVFPSYSSQYQQRLIAQLDQVRTDLAPFQEIADDFHAGSLTALINHHLNSDDPTFYAEGAAIQMMVINKSDLAKANAALNESPVKQAIFFMENIDYNLARSTWQSYTPSIVATPGAFKFSVAVGAALCLLSYFLLGSIRRVVRWTYRLSQRG